MHVLFNVIFLQLPYCNIISKVFLPGLKSHCFSERFHSEIVICLLRMSPAKIILAIEKSKMPLSTLY